MLGEISFFFLSLCLLLWSFVKLREKHRIQKRLQQVATNQANWDKKARSFEIRAKDYFEERFQMSRNAGYQKLAITEIRDWGEQDCPFCGVTNSLLMYSSRCLEINHDYIPKLREGLRAERPLWCYCSACQELMETDYLKYINTKFKYSYQDFLKLRLADLPYSDYPYEAGDYIYFLECTRKQFVHPKDCPEGYSIGIIIRMFPDKTDLDMKNFNNWRVDVLLTGGTHYPDLIPYEEAYCTDGSRIMQLDDLSLITYSFKL